MKYERAVSGGRDGLRDCLSWLKREKRVSEFLEKDGIRTHFHIVENNYETGRSRSIKILENRGKYIFMVDGKTVHTAGSLNACESWGLTAGYLKRGETAKPKTGRTAKPQPLISAKTAPAARTAAAPKLTPGPKYQPQKRQEPQKTPSLRRKTLADYVFQNGLN